MISIFRKGNVKTKNNNKEIELRGLSTDTKPQTIDGNSIENGTAFIEIDTGKIYFYDLTNKTWREI